MSPSTHNVGDLNGRLPATGQPARPRPDERRGQPGLPAPNGASAAPEKACGPSVEPGALKPISAAAPPVLNQIVSSASAIP